MLLVACLSLLATAQPPGVQGACPPVSDDGFNLGASCCQFVTPTLPLFVPTITFPGQYVVMEDCAVLATFDVNVTVAYGPAGGVFACDEPQVNINVTAVSPGAPSFVLDASSVHNLTQTAYAKYSRTYTQQAPLFRQTWRYLVNGEVSNWGAGVSPVAVPPCFGANFSTTPMQGYLDFSCGLENLDPPNPPVSAWRFALNLNHFVGCVAHADNPFNMQRMVSGAPNRHEDRSYHLVAPTPFNWLAQPLPDANAITFLNTPLDAVRSVGSHQPQQVPPCFSENRLSVALLRVVEDCYCSPSGGSPIYYHQTMPKDTAQPPTFNFVSCTAGGFTAFTTLSTISLPGDLPTGFVQQYLGQWPPPTDANPGDPLLAGVTLFANVGAIEYADFCGSSNSPLHGTYGVTTLADSPVWSLGFPPPATLVSVLTDFCDAINQDSFVDVPLGGAPAASNVVWQLSR